MTDTPPSDPYHAPDSNAADSPTARDDGGGSIGLGVGIFFLCLLVGGPLIGMGVRVLGAFIPGSSLFMSSVLPSIVVPWLLPIGVALWFRRRGLHKTARGIWISFAIVFGLALLLVAACFGMILLGGSNSWH